MGIRLLLLALALPACVRGQDSPAFEVASVKPSPLGVKTAIRRDPAGSFFATAIPLKTLVLFAYNIQDYQLAGLPTLATERYDVIAKPPAGAPKQQTWLMLQSLLADRFKLAIHKEERQLTIYALVVAKSGFKLQESRQPPGEADDSVKFAPGRITCIKVPMNDLALTLSSAAGHRVIDRTGIPGKFDLTLEWLPDLNPNPTDQPDRPGLFTAIEDQLGLKLIPEKGPVEVYVVDHLERPTTN